ncbi:MAG: AAA family ATPase [Flexilinea sp.]|nr:AAA family ATPase [Flexilinea sp.]
MDFIKEIDLSLRAKATLILTVSPEEERITEDLKALCQTTGRNCIVWDIAEGFSLLAGKNVPSGGRDPLSVLEQIDKADAQEAALFILHDFHECWDNPNVKRKLRDLARKLKYTRKSILVTAPVAEVPPELINECVVLNYPLPGISVLEGVLEKFRLTPGVTITLSPAGKEKLLQAALGLTASQAQRVFGKAIVTDGRLGDEDIDFVMREKKQLIRDIEALEFTESAETPENVGGLGELKHWLNLREKAFSGQARAYGLPAPKGIALIGIPGTGKSLTAKMISRLWHLPLIRLDVGALFGSLVGESEERVRRALSVVEIIAPCILWIDELEKALSHGGLDSGTSTRVFGSILTWMQEKTAPVFVVATANDVTALPPELLRRGRFDEIFFLDLPTEQERREIFEVHILKRSRLPELFDLDRLAKASRGFVGSEIEQAVIDAMYIGFNDKEREFTTEDILQALRHQVPLSVSQREQIEKLRSWLREGRAQSASFSDAADAESQFVPIQIEVAGK